VISDALGPRAFWIFANCNDEGAVIQEDHSVVVKLAVDHPNAFEVTAKRLARRINIMNVDVVRSGLPQTIDQRHGDCPSVVGIARDKVVEYGEAYLHGEAYQYRGLGGLGHCRSKISDEQSIFCFQVAVSNKDKIDVVLMRVLREAVYIV